MHQPLRGARYYPQLSSMKTFHLIIETSFRSKVSSNYLKSTKDNIGIFLLSRLPFSTFKSWKALTPSFILGKLSQAIKLK